MAKYPIKMLKDEEGNAFVPLTSSEALKTPDGKTLDEKLQNKLETTNIKAGTDINITVDGNNVTINNASKGVLIDNLTTETPGVGSLDAHQGKVLKEMIPEVVNNVTSTDSDKALSAYQGYLLSGKVVPTGGKEGQVLKKSSDTNWSLEWGDAADPNAIVGDGSIKKIIELTYEEYQALETIDPDTEYHIIDAQSAIDNLQATLDSLQEQINTVKGSLGKTAISNSYNDLDDKPTIPTYVIKDYMTIATPEEFKWSNNNVWVTVGFSRVVGNSGTKLSNIGNAIKIGTGVTKVRISSMLTFYQTPADEYLFSGIYINNVQVAKSITSTNMWGQIKVDWIANVNAGDIIELRVHKANNLEYVLHNFSGFGTGPCNYMTVEVIE
jgi:hypothetical protein